MKNRFPATGLVAMLGLVIGPVACNDGTPAGPEIRPSSPQFAKGGGKPDRGHRSAAMVSIWSPEPAEGPTGGYVTHLQHDGFGPSADYVENDCHVNAAMVNDALLFEPTEGNKRKGRCIRQVFVQFETLHVGSDPNDHSQDVGPLDPGFTGPTDPVPVQGMWVWFDAPAPAPAGTMTTARSKIGFVDNQYCSVNGRGLVHSPKRGSSLLVVTEEDPSTLGATRKRHVHSTPTDNLAYCANGSAESPDVEYWHVNIDFDLWEWQ